MTTGKTIALTGWTSVGKVMSLLFNMHCFNKQCRKSLSFAPPWEPRTPFSFSRAPDSLSVRASVRNPAYDKVIQKEAWQNEGRDQASGVPPGISWASTPQKIRICLLFHSSDILWKKSNQGFSLLPLKGMFQLNPSDSSLACLTGSPGPLTACELLTAPQPREAQSLKHLKDTEPFLKS